MAKKEVIDLLNQLLLELPQLRELNHDNEEFALWHLKTRDTLESAFGKNSEEYRRFTKAGVLQYGERHLPSEQEMQEKYLKDLGSYETLLKSIIQRQQIKSSSHSTNEKEIKIKAFIAHEGMTTALDKVKAFLDALGIVYLLAETEPSNGRFTEGQVDWTQGQPDFAIILATKGKFINKKTRKPCMGMNVADELGRARKVFQNHIILLVQTGVELHSNVSGIVYERFTPRNTEKAFMKIVKELRNWGFLRIEKT